MGPAPAIINIGGTIISHYGIKGTNAVNVTNSACGANGATGSASTAEVPPPHRTAATTVLRTLTRSLPGLHAPGRRAREQSPA